MTRRFVMTAAAALLAAASLPSCSRQAEATPGNWATGTVRIEGSDYAIRNITFEASFDGEDSYYTLDADPVVSPDADCVPGLSSRMSLYGSLPASAGKVQDLVGRRLPVEFSGDGDDANLCFVGTNGLLGAEEAWVTIDSVESGKVTFTMSGSFQLYDEEAEPRMQMATAGGTAWIAPSSR